MLPGPQVGDPYTVIALKGLLETLLDQGTIIVSTSNLPIRQLNSHGVHEDLFTGFQERLLAACNEVELSAEQDYRLSFGRVVLQEVPPCSSTISVHSSATSSFVSLCSHPGCVGHAFAWCSDWEACLMPASGMA